MSRWNFTAIWCVSLVSLVCYYRVEHNPYGRYFLEMMETIHRNSLKEVDRQPLFDAAADGMTSLLDKHSRFVSRTDKKQHDRELQQHFSGIGITLRQVDDGPGKKQLVVRDTIIGTPRPAYDAGMRRGDVILAIDGHDTTKLSLAEATRLIQEARAGEPVRIRVLHEGKGEPVELSVVRQDIQVDAVVGDVRQADGSWRFLLPTKPPIAYVRIFDAFGDNTVQQLRDALGELKRRGQLQALIVDIRDNGGGYLHVADDVCKMFIDGGVIVTTRSRIDELTHEQDVEVHEADEPGPFRGFPMAVLINGDSASASEIVAACLQDHHRAAIVGSRSFGKGVVEKVFPMEMGQSALQLTTATYWRPSGKNIQRMPGATETDEWGVRPDKGLEVKLSDKQELDRLLKRQERDAFRPAAAGEPAAPLDPQLARAVEYLQSQLADNDKAGKK